jgi:hypothetical protein
MSNTKPSDESTTEQASRNPTARGTPEYETYREGDSPFLVPDNTTNPVSNGARVHLSPEERWKNYWRGDRLHRHINNPFYN